MNHLKLHKVLLQHSILVDGEPDRQCDVIVVQHLVLLDGTVVCLAAVLCSGRVRKVPFDEGLARREWYVVQVDNLVAVSPVCFARG